MTQTATQTQWPHARHAQNRIAKAQRFVAKLEAFAFFSAALDAKVLAELGPALWALIADQISEDAPSEVTAAIICGIVAGRAPEDDPDVTALAKEHHQ